MTWTFRSEGRRSEPVEVHARRHFEDSRGDTYWAQQISQTFRVDGREYPPGSWVVKAASRTYAYGLLSSEFARWEATVRPCGPPSSALA